MKFNKDDLIAVLKGLGVALVGAALTYLTGWITKTDFGVYGPIIVAFWGVVANVVRKLVDQPVNDMVGKNVL